MVSTADFFNRADEDACLAQQLSRPKSLSDWMSQSLVTVREDQPLTELIEVLLQSGLHHLPVVDAAGRVTGMITPTNLLQVLHGGRLSDRTDAQAPG